jgi:hypothetical protein
MGKQSGTIVLALTLITVPVLGCGGGDSKARTKHSGSANLKKESTATPSDTATQPDPKVTVAIVAAPTAALDQGASFAFAAVVNGAADLDVTWKASQGSISASGLFVAPAAGGTVTVTATSAADPTVSDTVTVSVNHVTVAASGPTGLYDVTTAKYTATVAGTVLTKSVTWSVAGTGDVGSVDAAGIFTPNPHRGGYTATVKATSAADATKSASVNVSVWASSIAVQPATVTLFPGESAQLAVQAVGVGSNAVWSADGGSITPAGLYTAPGTTGSFTVTAQSTQAPWLSATAAVTVVLRPVITVSGTATDLLPGGTASFAASVTNGAAGVVWSADCGTIDQAGNYTAPAAPAVCHIAAASAAYPGVTTTITVTICGALDTVLTYANPGTTPADTRDDVITSRVRLAFAAAGTMFTSYDSLDAAWLSTQAAPLASARTYGGPGLDGRWFTADDAVGAFYAVLADGNGLQSGYARHGTAGTDGVYGTADDEILEVVTYARNAAGQVTTATHAVTAGADALWGTADDGIASFDVYAYDGAGFLVRAELLNGAGKINRYRTFANDAYGRPVTVTNYVNPGVTQTWLDGDDRYNRQYLYAYDEQGRPATVVEKVFVSADSTPQPANDREVVYTYAGNDRMPVAMDQFSSGGDKLIGTADDTLRAYERSSQVCPW